MHSIFNTTKTYNSFAKQISICILKHYPNNAATDFTNSSRFSYYWNVYSINTLRSNICRYRLSLTLTTVEQTSSYFSRSRIQFALLFNQHYSDCVYIYIYIYAKENNLPTHIGMICQVNIYDSEQGNTLCFAERSQCKCNRLYTRQYYFSAVLSRTLHRNTYIQKIIL